MLSPTGAIVRHVESAGIILQHLPTLRHTLRIAVVTETYPPEINGVAMTLGRMVQGLQQRQHELQLVRPSQGLSDRPAAAERFEEMLKPGIPIPRYSNLRMGLPAKQALVRAWTLKRPDIVHIATEGPLGWSALNACLKLKIPVSTDFHTNFHSYTRHYGVGWLNRPILGYLRKFHNRAGVTLVPTRGMRAELEREGFANLKVVARGVDTGLFNPQRRSPELRRQWGVGADGLAAEKNLPLVLRAFAAIRTRNPKAQLVLVGDGPARGALQAQSPRHVFAGMRSGEDLAVHYACGDLFLFPSVTETYGNVVLEAMASGLAVVAYNYAAAREHLRHGESGLLAELGDAEGFVGCCLDLANDRQRVAALGAAARRSAESLTWDRIHDALEDALREVIRRSAARQAPG